MKSNEVHNGAITTLMVLAVLVISFYGCGAREREEDNAPLPRIEKPHWHGAKKGGSK